MSEQKLQRENFPFIRAIATRWTDNDIYGHVNNAIYYHFFDTVINMYLIAEGGLDIQNGNEVGFMVRSECDYLSPLTYPGDVDVGVAIAKIGNSSVTYKTALFQPGSDQPAAIGSMVHVFVNKATNKPVPVPPQIRAALERISLR